jgi:hypothetical protein
VNAVKCPTASISTSSASASSTNPAFGNTGVPPRPFLDTPSHAPAFVNAVHEHQRPGHQHQHHPRLRDYPAFGNTGVLPCPLPRRAKPFTNATKCHITYINVLGISLIHYPIPFLDMLSHAQAFANTMKCPPRASTSSASASSTNPAFGNTGVLPRPFLDTPSHAPAFVNAVHEHQRPRQKFYHPRAIFTTPEPFSPPPSHFLPPPSQHVTC